MVDENSDWPPRRLVEITADHEVRKFRTKVENGKIFEKLEDLPELVGKATTEKLQSMHGESRVGLADWERRYLDFRLPAWRSGRTALSQPHLFDAEQAQELYQPDLYIALDGTSANWVRGSDGHPRRPSRSRQARRDLAFYEQSRVRLAKWLCARDLPRIALVGAPGGGKTIFLTRIAASFGNACLGRKIDLEPELDVEQIRQEFGLPVPIVLEATRLAQNDLSRVDALLSAILAEISAAGDHAIDREQLETGLREGRYLLLIDALDEIADANSRSNVLTLIKGISSPAMFPRTRLLLTTRSARYTGRLRFGPELETVEVAALDRQQVKELCYNWSRHRQRDPEYRDSLMSAVSGLSEQVDTGGEDQALTENPLMLTAICMVFERYRSLPDDRGRLSELLIDDLCRSRRSEDTDRGWRLDETAKKDLLQRIALAMQEQGAQSWPVGRAVEIASHLVPTSETSRTQRATRYVDWAADHTGILRFQEASGGEEQIRFWHRLFREYLSANRIAQEDSTADAKITQLWSSGRLLNPFWEDVVRLLPRSLGTIEKARSVLLQLDSLADNNPQQRGRLLGLAAAGVIENRDLFPDVVFADRAAHMASTFATEGLQWPLTDRVLFLEALGRLDPVLGDPRLRDGQWAIRPTPHASLGDTAARSNGILALSRWPVTVQEFRRFSESDGFKDTRFWEQAPQIASVHERDTRIARFHMDLEELVEATRENTRSQHKHPNRPVVQVPLGAALAFCCWLTAQRSDGKIIRLMRLEEWREFAPSRGRLSRTAQFGLGDYAKMNWAGAGLGRPSPVGAFPPDRLGAFDLLGNVWEFGVPEKRVTEKGDQETYIPLFGGDFNFDPEKDKGKELRTLHDIRT